MNNAPLKAALQGCSDRALIVLSMTMLTRSGFHDVQILDHRYRAQRLRDGEIALICTSTLNRVPVTVVVKVANRSVKRRHLDELSITIIRTGAESGMIVSPFHVTPKAQAILDRYRTIRASVVDGELLTTYCEALGIGLRGEGAVDYAFFGELEAVAERWLKHLSSPPP